MSFDKKKAEITVLIVLALIIVIPLAAVADDNNSVQITSPRILVYDDDDFFHKPPNSYIQQALSQLGLSYTGFFSGSSTDISNFNTNLTSGGPWDLVIVDESNPLTDPGFNNISNYVNNGGKLIIGSLNMPPTTTLWSSIGVVFRQNAVNPQRPNWFNPFHPITSGLPNFTSINQSEAGLVPDVFVDNLTGTTQIGGFATSPTANKSALVLRNDKKTLFRAFPDDDIDDDLNGNGIPDPVELWKNSICYILGGGCSNKFVFVQGTDNATWYKTFDGTNWSSWQTVGGASFSDPDGATFQNGVTSSVNGNTFLFVRGTDNALWYNTFNGTSWVGWSSLGGVLNSAPGSSQWFGNIYVFVRGTDNALWYRTFNGETWSNWISLGGVLTSGPGA